jgi:quinol monooxygenase YgiN
MTTHLIVSFVAKQERVADFLALLRDVKTHLPEVAGCEAVSVFQDRDQPHRFTLIEAWRSPAHHRAHLENMQRSGSWERLVSQLAAEPIHSYFQSL